MLNKVSTSIRLSQKAKQLIRLMAEKLGISQSAIIELAIREKAEKEGVGRD